MSSNRSNKELPTDKIINSQEYNPFYGATEMFRSLNGGNKILDSSLTYGSNSSDIPSENALIPLNVKDVEDEKTPLPTSTKQLEKLRKIFHKLPRGVTLLTDWEWELLEKAINERPVAIHLPDSVLFFLAQFIKGGRFVTQIAWPLALYGVLINDIHSFDSQPQYRYGNDLGSIFLGGSANELTWSSYLGSDLRTELTYNMVFGILAGLPALAGAIKGIISHVKIKGEYIFATDREEFRILHSENNSGELSYYNILSVATSDSVIYSCGAVTSLATIAKHSKRRSLALEELKSIAESLKAPRDYYANYQLWKLGQLNPNRNKLHAIFWPLAISQLYAKFRYWRIIAEKIKGIVDYDIAVRECNNQGMQYFFRPEIANYDCSSCNTPLVSYTDSQTAQGCLNGILSRLQTPAAINDLMDAIQYQAGSITVVDFSRQQWEMWSYDKWDTFLNYLETVAASSLKRFDLSNMFPLVGEISIQKFERLAQFLKKIPVEELLLADHKLDQEGLSALLPGLENNTTRLLDLTGNALNYRGMSLLSEKLPHMRFLQTLKLGNNELTSDCIEDLSKALKIRGEKINLDLSANAMSEGFIKSVAEMASEGLLQILNLSEMIISAACIKIIAPQIKYLTGLIIRSAELDDVHLTMMSPYLADARNMSLYDFTDNRIEDYGIISFFTNVYKNISSTVSMARNIITDKGIDQSARYMGEIRQLTLDISDNDHLTANGLSTLIHHAGEALKSLNVANIRSLSDQAARALAGWITSERNNLQTIILANTGIGRKGANALFQALESYNSSITDLDISFNDINGAELSRHVSGLAKLITLDLSNCRIDDTAGSAIANVLSKSHLLKKLLLNANSDLSEKMVSALAQQLITYIPHFEDLGGVEWLSRDFRRYAYHNARPHTNLTHFEMKDCKLSELSARELCRIQKYSRIPTSEYLLNDNNPVDFSKVNLDTCQTSAASPRFTSLRIFRWLREGLQQIPQVNPLYLLTPAINIGSLQQIIIKKISNGVQQAELLLESAKNITIENNAPESSSRSSALPLILLSLTASMLVIYFLSRVMRSGEEQSTSARLLSYGGRSSGLFRPVQALTHEHTFSENEQHYLTAAMKYSGGHNS